MAYTASPPHSGQHSPVPAEDDLYEEPVRKEEAVHALEHGRVVIWVRPSAGEEVLADLRALYDEDPYHVIVTPDPKLEHAVAASAWTHTLTCPRPSEALFDALRAFKEKWRDKGPEFAA